MHVAIEQGHYEVVVVLVQAGANVNKEFNGMSPLYRAAELGHPEIVELLVQAGADRALSYQNLTPLLVAVQKGHMHVVQLLMSNSSQNMSLGASSRPAAGMVQTGVQENALEHSQIFGRRESSAVSSSVVIDRLSFISVSLQVTEGAQVASSTAAAAAAFW